MDTGQRLAAAMERSGKTREQIAMETGLARSTLSRMCSGDRVGSLSSWLLVASCLGVRLEELLGP